MRRAVAAGVALAVALVRAGAAQADVSDRVAVELAAERSRVFAGEPFRIVVRIAIDETFLRENVVQPFRRALDLPVRVELPWLGEPGQDVSVGGAVAEGASLVLNDELAHARRGEPRTIDGERFLVFEVARQVVARRPGELRVPAPRVHVDHATRFRESFLDGRVPEDRRTVVIDGEALEVRVAELPAMGRPADFSGVVGTVTAEATVDRTAVEVGESLQLTLLIAGEGNLEALQPPGADRFPGFHVIGRIESPSAEGRTFVYELAPVRHVREVPAIELSFFDPAPPGRYRVARTEPIALEVTGGDPDAEPVATPAEQPVVATERDIFGPKRLDGTGEGGRGTVRLLAVLALVLPWLWGLSLLGGRVLQGRRARREVAARRRLALREFAARCERGEALEALTDYLATRLDLPAAAVVTPDLDVRLVAAGVSAPLAQRTRDAVAALVDARHAQAAHRAVGGDLRELTTALEAELTG